MATKKDRPIHEIILAIDRKLRKGEKGVQILYSKLTLRVPIFIKGRKNGKYNDYIIELVHREKQYEDSYTKGRIVSEVERLRASRPERTKLTDEEKSAMTVIKQETIKKLGRANGTH